jgi:hypothetical protein
LLGIRPPDKATFKYFEALADEIVILQHADKRRRKLFELNIKYFIQNFTKLCYWISYISVAKLLRLVIGGKKSGKCRVMYYQAEYLNEWCEAFPEYRFEGNLCSYPDVTNYGPIVNIPVNDNFVEAFLIDEPFTATLGITISEEKKIIESMLRLVNLDSVYVKLHPRSDKNKYDDYHNVIIVDWIPRSVDKLFAYNSGLLAYPFDVKEFYKLAHANKSDYCWELSQLTKTATCCALCGYVDDVRALLNG